MFVKSSNIALALAVVLPAVSARATPQSSVGPSFGSCVPTIKFEGGSFLPEDANVAQGQEGASNPEIITNHVCNQLSSTCGADQDANTLCQDVQAQIENLDVEGQAFADTWNALINGGSAPKAELKKRQRQFVACSPDAWIDNCTGWPRKRDEPAQEPAPVVKKSVVEAPKVKAPVVKKSTNEKRQVAFIPCSTEAWVDNCTGWP